MGQALHIGRHRTIRRYSQPKTVSIRADIDIVSNRDKSAETHPDFRVATQGVETGAGWIRRGENSGKDEVRLSLTAPEFGPRKRSANLLPRCWPGRRQRLCRDLESVRPDKSGSAYVHADSRPALSLKSFSN